MTVWEQKSYIKTQPSTGCPLSPKVLLQLFKKMSLDKHFCPDFICILPEGLHIIPVTSVHKKCLLKTTHVTVGAVAMWLESTLPRGTVWPQIPRGENVPRQYTHPLHTSSELTLCLSSVPNFLGRVVFSNTNSEHLVCLHSCE